MYKVAVVQFLPHFLDVEYNLLRMKQLLRSESADLFVLPELCTSGYVFNTRDEVRSAAENVPSGKCFSAMQQLSTEIGASVVYGFPELCAENIYNSSALVNPDGSYFIYRKTHLFNTEKLVFDAGNTGFFVATGSKGVRLGMMICFDWQFPEAARTLALKGAQVICHPSNLVLPWCQEAMKTRSLENRIFSITANRIGTERNGDTELYFTGMSQILSTKGEVLYRLPIDTEEIAVVEIDPFVADNKTVTPRNDAFTDRRPEFYFNGE